MYKVPMYMMQHEDKTYSCVRQNAEEKQAFDALKPVHVAVACFTK